jgi:hypothetical protein
VAPQCWIPDTDVTVELENPSDLRRRGSGNR